MYNKVMSKDQAERTIELLATQATKLRSNNQLECAAQNERIIKRLKTRIKSGKYN